MHLVVTPDLSRWECKDEDEYAHVRRLGIVSDTEHQAVDAARGEVLAMLAERSGILAQAERWAAWRWVPAWPTPRLPRPTAPRGEGCTGRGLKGCLEGCSRRGTEGVTGSGSPASRTRPVVPGQPYWASLFAPTTPPSHAIAVGERSSSLPGAGGHDATLTKSVLYAPARSVPRPRLHPGAYARPGWRGPSP
ncbi:hypothetical protein Snoj_26200 [Streptomyces nojiriensis]|uniref:Uncharacterized protein n=1 Tax=Streptomyces nojiriensis TaxID=66374 RepID=A0ABQ3SL58_9ACTN|nr:hypothetical protein GCM10010205_69800 [Streptomyces nojiriensis]GHI68702.1 hypothetical protein Snoj_26200 [Streptomyces nojiriensis]